MTSDAPKINTTFEGKIGTLYEKDEVCLNRKGSVAVGSKAAGGKGKKAVAITGSGGDMRKNRVFQIMRQVRSQSLETYDKLFERLLIFFIIY